MILELLSTSKQYIYIAIGILFLTLFSYTMYLRYDNVKLDTKNTELTLEVAAQKKNIEVLQASILDIQKAQNSIKNTIEINAGNQQKLDEKLSKLSKVSIEKPTLVTKLVNKGQDERNRCFALATGAIKLKNEKNSLCPELVK